MLAAWWPTSEGADLAQRLEVALLNIVIRDGWLVHDARRNRDTEPALKAARNDHQQARSLANNLRAEVRGQAAPARSSPRVGCAVLLLRPGQVGSDDERIGSDRPHWTHREQGAIWRRPPLPRPRPAPPQPPLS
jgi:hypothetical protein